MSKKGKTPKNPIPNTLDIITALWNSSNFVVRYLVRFVIGSIFVWPFIMIGVAMFSPSILLKASLVLVPVLLILLFFYGFRYPLVAAIGLPETKLRKVARFMLSALGFELLLGLALAIFPIYAAKWSAPVLFIALLVAILTASLPPESVRARSLIRKALAIVVLLTIFSAYYYQAQIEGWTNKEAEAAEGKVVDARNVQQRTEPFQAQVELLGEDTFSETIDLDTLIPKGWHYTFEGPASALVWWGSSDTPESLFADGRVRAGKIRFTGPKGEKVTIKSWPQGTPPPGSSPATGSEVTEVSKTDRSQEIVLPKPPKEYKPQVVVPRKITGQLVCVREDGRAMTLETDRGRMDVPLPWGINVYTHGSGIRDVDCLVPGDILRVYFEKDGRTRSIHIIKPAVIYS